MLPLSISEGERGIAGSTFGIERGKAGMQIIKARPWHWLKIQALPRHLVLILMTAVLAGCATGGGLKPETADQGPSLTEGSTVSRLEEGREGFVIVEVPSMDAESRRDFDRAVAMIEDRDYDKAIVLLEKVIERSPGVTAPFINIAIAYKQIDQPEQAEQHLKSALNLVPQHPVANNEYGLLLRKTGRFAEARMIYERTLTNFPDYHPARRNLGILCDLYLNDLTCALEHYEIYSAAMPADQQVKLWVADLNIRLGLKIKNDE
jgi:Flp pilus assembly protein TadD